MELIIVLIVALVLYVIVAYNGMIKLRNRVKEGWSDIDVQLKRRYNLIPNIVETVKGYAAHEEQVFTKVTEARANAINATNVHEQGAAENMLSGALKSLFAVAENYPDLKANENFMQLQNELVDTEDKIQAARRFYNGVVRDFNTKIQQFPAKLIAGMFKFKEEEFFEIEDEEQRENVEVSFNKEGTHQAEAPAPTAATPAPTPEAPKVEEPATPAAETPTPEAPATPEEPKTEEPAEPEVPAPVAEEKTEEPAPAPEAEKPSEESAPAEAPAPTPEAAEPAKEEVVETQDASEEAAPETPAATEAEKPEEVAAPTEPAAEEKSEEPAAAPEAPKAEEEAPVEPAGPPAVDLSAEKPADEAQNPEEEKPAA